jgi:hypothetical protein
MGRPISNMTMKYGLIFASDAHCYVEREKYP